jgi:hypothetical protein
LIFGFSSARPRGWFATSVAALVVVVLVPLPSSAAVTVSGSLTVSIPGPFEGCSYYGPTTNDALRAVLDLVRPSAFQTNALGELVGAPGPITQAELVSLTPQTVIYSVAPHWLWSNGRPFNGLDLIAWYEQALKQTSSATDGYRDISSLTTNTTGTQVTAVFNQPFADWNTLFRDINERSVEASCTLSSLASQPSLGPYRLVSLTASTAVLAENLQWLGNKPQFRFVTIRTNLAPAQLPSTPTVDYRNAATLPEMAKLSSQPTFSGEIGSSDQLVVVGFSPHRVDTFQLAVRQFLSLLINRQTLLNQIVGPVSYAQGVADSVLYAQGQLNYPGAIGVTPSQQALAVAQTTLPTSVGVDCVTCAAPVLEASGYHREGTHWANADEKILTVDIAVGPTEVDRATAQLIAAQWRAAGVPSVRSYYSSDVAVANALAHGRVDAGVMTESTGVVPSLSARSWTGVDAGDTYDIGWRSPLIDQWFATAQDTFNPADTIGTYADIDQYITTQAWERPLFTEPSILMWSAGVVGVDQSSSMIGLIDQVPTWGEVLPY